MRTKMVLPFSIILLSCVFASCRKESETAYWPTVEWKLSIPQRVAMDASILNGLDSVQDSLPGISSILAIRHGYLVYEKYYEGDATTFRPAYSMAKSVISALIGIAIKQGLIQDADQKLVEFFPDNEILKADPIAQRITLRHLLTMSDEIRNSGNAVESYFSDPKASKRIIGDPGYKFSYSELSAQVVSLILTKVSRKTALDFGKQYLFEPIGIKDVTWRVLKIDGTETNNGADGIKLTSRDFAKIGYLYLKKGTWENRELIPEKWIAESTVAQITTDASPDSFKYGFLWWVHAFKDQPCYLALGLGGQGVQIICIVPGLDLVAVVTNKERMRGSAVENVDASMGVIEKFIIDSIRS